MNRNEGNVATLVSRRRAREPVADADFPLSGSRPLLPRCETLYNIQVRKSKKITSARPRALSPVTYSHDAAATSPPVPFTDMVCLSRQVDLP